MQSIRGDLNFIKRLFDPSPWWWLSSVLGSVMTGRYLLLTTYVIHCILLIES